MRERRFASLRRPFPAGPGSLAGIDTDAVFRYSSTVRQAVPAD